MLTVIEAARTKWPDISDDVAIRETTALQVEFAVLRARIKNRLPWGPRRPNYFTVPVALKPVGKYWLGYNAKHSVLFVNFRGEHHVN